MCICVSSDTPCASDPPWGPRSRMGSQRRARRPTVACDTLGITVGSRWGVLRRRRKNGIGDKPQTGGILRRDEGSCWTRLETPGQTFAGLFSYTDFPDTSPNSVHPSGRVDCKRRYPTETHGSFRFYSWSARVRGLQVLCVEWRFFTGDRWNITSRLILTTKRPNTGPDQRVSVTETHSTEVLCRLWEYILRNERR